MEVSGPKRRKPLRTLPSQLSSPEKDDIIASTVEISYEEQHLNYSREGSVNRSQNTSVQEKSIDPGVADECTDDDSEPSPERERSVSPPVSREDIENSLKNSSKNRSEKMSTRRRSPSNLQSNGLDSDVYTDDMDPIPENEPTKRRKIPPLRKASISPVPAPFYMESLQKRETTTSGNEYIAYGVIVAFLLLVLLGYLQADLRTKAATSCNHFHALEKRYTSFDESLWYTLNATVTRATADVEEREPGTVLFLHYGRTVMLDGFINSVSNITAECFGGMEPIMLDGKYFKRTDIQADYGVFLAQQKEALRQHGVLVVRNLEDVPARAAQAFHTICDTQEPLVDRAVIYLTLDMLKAAAKPTPSKQSATAEAEKLLHELWKDALQPAVLQPLITRLTENVFRIL
ncbi:uncharacterized protein LOC126560929 [Anopheles maculipalpis]|uniref:uncharacterized protein LOC126560929 n=1 Tax=Anopheles maculipalpis TaxID=1496333 RepID=UPI0021592013|nr:uncharacterized protein LOC126560929 [Anopheles maculipalpis]